MGEKGPVVGRKSDQRRAREIPSDVRRAQLIERFSLRASDLADARIVRLLNFKLALDIEIGELLRAGAREASVKRFAALAGFTEKDMARDWPLVNLVKSIQDSRQCVTTLRPPKKAATEAKTNAKAR
jgi:hypothetical protein